MQLRPAWANASNTPFRLYKHWVHKGGIASPFIARWPRVVKQKNRLVHHPTHVVEIMATCLDVAGAQYPKSYQGREIVPLEGMSLVPLLRDGKGAGREALFWEHEGNRAARQGRYKLVSRHPDGWEIYDMVSDRTELKDLSEERPDLVKEMLGRYDDWAARCGALPWDTVRQSSLRALRCLISSIGPGVHVQCADVHTDGQFDDGIQSICFTKLRLLKNVVAIQIPILRQH